MKYRKFETEIYILISYHWFNSRDERRSIAKNKVREWKEIVAEIFSKTSINDFVINVINLNINNKAQSLANITLNKS